MIFQVQKPVIISNDELVENGMSPLDGILPKDPKFGVLDGDMVSELLETSKSELLLFPPLTFKLARRS